MGIFRRLCEDIRDAVDTDGMQGCFKRSAVAFEKASGIPQTGLWAAVDGILKGYDVDRMTKKLIKTWGGTPEMWNLWVSIVRTKPDCPGSEQ